MVDSECGPKGACVYVPRYGFQSCPTCEVQQSHIPTTTANHESSVLPCVCQEILPIMPKLRGSCSYIPTSPANHQFIVPSPAGGQPKGHDHRTCTRHRQQTTAPAFVTRPRCTKTNIACPVCVCVCVCVCQGINSNHAQTARFNRTMFLQLLQTMSSLFSPAGGAPDGLMLSICTVAAHAPQLLPSEPAMWHQDTR